MIKFGDIFRFNEQEFVFLAQTHEITYAAKVLNLDDTKSVLRLYEIRNAGNSEKINNVLYSFVILNTPEFKNRMAHLNNTDQNGHHDRYQLINTTYFKNFKKIYLSASFRGVCPQLQPPSFAEASEDKLAG